MSVEELRRRYLGEPFAESGNSPTSSSTSHEIVGSSSQVQMHAFSEQACSSSSAVVSSSSYGYFEMRPDGEYDEEEEEDEEYAPPEYWKKAVRVGPEYQVSSLPNLSATDEAKNGIATSTTATAEEGESAKAMWIARPDLCPESKVEHYLCECEKIRYNHATQPGLFSSFPTHHGRKDMSVCHDPAVVKDDENILYALLKAHYNVEMAKGASQLFDWPNVKCVNGARLTYAEPWTHFSEEDCTQFEGGLRTYGKNFWSIKNEKMPERSVGELVRFYYTWKKTERHDIFVERNKQAFADNKQRTVVDSANTTDFMGTIMDLMNGNAVNGSNDVAYSQMELESTVVSTTTKPLPTGRMTNNSLGTCISPMAKQPDKGWLHVGGSPQTNSSGTHKESGKSNQ
ncbi:mesoderm induction early response protein 1 [Ditylenchus destructor]|uniref:Mesoderm induction early response protein 1 n=1 Tax=Ditylenchus destructor TaxID=166010 RepID=A0AAD4N1T7_9BILA|nr:mesoderm induction early response protein 1 [Ditylenchus destructor]